MPPIGKDVLVTDGSAQQVSVLKESRTFDFWGNNNFWQSEDVTHWMPLPKSPKPNQ
jgi:hypothetical protein